MVVNGRRSMNRLAAGNTGSPLPSFHLHLGSRLSTGFWKRVAPHIVKEPAAFRHDIFNILTQPLFGQSCPRRFNLSHQAPCYLVEMSQ